VVLLARRRHRRPVELGARAGVGPVLGPAPGHVGRVLGQGREPEPAATFLHRDRIVEVPGHELAVVVEHELRAVELLAPVVHSHAVVEVREVHWVGVVEVDGPLEVLERAALQADIVDGALRHEPGRLLAVVAHQAAARPALVVVEDVPESFARVEAVGLLGEGEELVVQVGVVAPGNPSGPHTPEVRLAPPFLPLLSSFWRCSSVTLTLQKRQNGSVSGMSSSFSLVARDLARAWGSFTVLDGVDLTVGPRTRLGVVGPNGVGKSTLLKLLAGVEQPDRGSVTRTPPTARVGYLPQEPERGDETLGDFLARRTGVAAAEVELERAAHALGEGAPGSDDEYSAALDAYLESGADDFAARVGTVCADVGLPERLLVLPTSALSGGQAARASLAAILLSRFDVFLLDEPTNDLDFAGLERLEQFLDELPGGVVVVSHDRAFLERTISRVLELDEHTHRGTEFGGGWLGYLEARSTARRRAEEDYATFQAEKSRLASRARMQREWSVQGKAKAKKDTSEKDKNIRQFRRATSEKVAAKSKITDRALERLDAVEKPWEGWDLRYQLAGAPRSGDVVMRLHDAVVTRGDFRLGPLSLEVGWGERLAVVGPNGTGKTTLLLALLGRLPLEQGDRYLGPGVVIGEMDQGRATFGGDATLLDAFIAATGLIVSEARSLLAKFGLGAEHVIRAASSLSPGERTRAVLAQFQAQGVNCLVLDEPTNHLDLPAIDQLEQALDGYDGTLLLVTHDRRLLEAVHLTRAITPTGEDIEL